jgi:hypothetical protein
MKALLWIVGSLFGLFLLIGIVGGSASQSSAQSSYGYGSGAAGTWSLTIFTDDAGPITRDGFASRDACFAAAQAVARDLQARVGAAAAARMATRSSCFQRSSR